MGGEFNHLTSMQSCLMGAIWDYGLILELLCIMEYTQRRKIKINVNVESQRKILVTEIERKHFFNAYSPNSQLFILISLYPELQKINLFLLDSCSFST